MARVLIVDDSAFARNSLKLTVEKGGHEVVGRAGNGREAVSLFTRLQPEVVMLDYLMAGETGNEVLVELIRIDPDAKVIMISGMGHPAIQEEALQFGATCFLTKPYEREDILQMIDKALHV